MESAAIRLRWRHPNLEICRRWRFEKSNQIWGRLGLVIGHLLDCASIHWVARCRPVPPRHRPPGAGVRSTYHMHRGYLHDQPPARTSVVSTLRRNPDRGDFSGHRRSHIKESNGPGQHCSLKIVHRGCTGNAHVIRSQDKRESDGVIRKGPHMGRFLDMVLSSAKRQIGHPIGIGIDVDPRVTKCAYHGSGFVLPVSDPAAQVLHFSSGCCGGWRRNGHLDPHQPLTLLSVGFGSSSDVSGNDMFSGRVDYLWLPLLSEWTSDIGLFLFGAGRYGIVTSKLWDPGNLIHADHAHNAIFNFFLDCGMILTGVLVIFLAIGTVAAWRVGRRLNSDLYWALFACMFGCGISMATQGDILPRIDSMYAFPIIAMMINLARLHRRMPVMVDPVLQNWRDVDSTTVQK